MKKSVIVEVIALVFVVLFLYTGISKVMEYHIFKEQIGESPLFKSVSPVIARVLPITEFLIAILLFMPQWRLKGLYGALGLMIIFTTYILYILSFNENLPCSCGGVLQALSWKGHLIFNSIFISLALIAIYIGRRLKKTLNQETI